MPIPCKSKPSHTAPARRKRTLVAACAAMLLLSLAPAARADQLRMTDGTVIEVDAAWEDAQGIWYRRGGVTHLVERGRVRSIEHAGDRRASESSTAETHTAETKTTGAKRTKQAGAQQALVKFIEGETAGTPTATSSAAKSTTSATETNASVTTTNATLPIVLIHLVGGARMEVDEATEGADGVWYRRGNLSIFIERSRIERIEREQPEEIADADTPNAPRRVRRERFWTTGSVRLDALIRQNGSSYGVDPYLIFCVMEQESHFNARVTSPKGAGGLMQLMPGTAARFGVRNAHDPAQNVRGGTRYLKELLGKFGGRVDLVLASYNAGEGAVMKYGHRVPPYRETRNYVRRISARYQQRLAVETASVQERAGGMR